MGMGDDASNEGRPMFNVDLQRTWDDIRRCAKLVHETEKRRRRRKDESQ